MKYLIAFIFALIQFPVWGQTNDFSSRKPEIEKCTIIAYSVGEFHRIADSIHMSLDELCDYPVIFPIKQPLRISSVFGMRYHPVYGKRKFHKGIDIPKTKGTAVYATGNGTVIRKGHSSGYGYFIEIRHAGDFRSFYAHLSRTMVDIGDSVSITQQIACVGNTGVTTGSHLHYEIRKGKRFLNPLEWCHYLFMVIHINKNEITT